MPSLEITVDGKTRRVALEKAILSIGRQADNDVVIDDARASRQHCTLEHHGDVIRLRDLNSRNGTWMDDNRIAEAELGDGDVFRIGHTVFRVCLEKAAAEQANGPKGETAEITEIIDVPSPVEKAHEPAAPPAGLTTGPLARQIAPLIKAARTRPGDRSGVAAPSDVRFLDRQHKPLRVKSGDTSRPAEAVQVLQQLLFAAFRVNATDLHMEPHETVYGIRLRIDGLLHAVAEITRPMGLALANIVKVLCQLDIAKKNVVQEGNFATELPSRRVDFRVSFSPTMHGQKLALRILDTAAVPRRFEDLGMEPSLAEELRRVSGQDSGMIVVSGPTGSGKTTTLYTALRNVDVRTRNVVTIEDPVEYQIEHATQIAIDRIHNITFASVLAGVLRQDPDVIFVGEVRDRETASLAMQAATTGHLVLTTVHARDTIGTIFRLLDLGVEPFQVANAVTLAIAQRLVRLLCPHCKREYRPDARHIRDLRLDERQPQQLYTNVGCVRCMNTGFSGRTAIFEVLMFTTALRDVILTRPTVGDIRKAAGDWMFRSLLDSGYRKALDGLTTIEEVERVASAD